MFFYTIFAYGQQKNVIAVYGVKGIEDPRRALIDDMVLKKNSFFLEEMSKQTFTLVADSKTSFFKIDGTPSKDIQRDFVTWFGGGINGIWQDGNAAYIEVPKNPVNESDFIMELPLIKDWTITQESKMIEGFRCFKAVSRTKTVTPQGKEFVKMAVAWFCPEIPFSYGPMKHGRLPGLIMELQTDSYLFGLRKLSFDSSYRVKPMPDLKIVTEADHQKQFLERARNRTK